MLHVKMWIAILFLTREVCIFWKKWQKKSICNCHIPECLINLYILLYFFTDGQRCYLATALSEVAALYGCVNCFNCYYWESTTNRWKVAQEYFFFSAVETLYKIHVQRCCMKRIAFWNPDGSKCKTELYDEKHNDDQGLN